MKIVDNSIESMHPGIAKLILNYLRTDLEFVRKLSDLLVVFPIG